MNISKEVVGVVGIIIGSLLTGGWNLINTFFVLRAERKHLQRKEALDGLLSVHDGLTEMSNVYGRFVTQSLSSHIGNELKPLEGLQASQTLSRLFYLLSLYAPELMPEFRMIENSSKQFMQKWTDSVLAVTRGQKKPEVVRDLVGLMHDQVQQIADFQIKLADFAHRLYFKG